MIGALLRAWFTTLRRDRVAQAMVFLLPIVFFTIFANVFGGRSGATPRVHVAIADEAHTTLSARIVAALQREKSLDVTTTAREDGAPKTAPVVPLTRARAARMVKDGDVPVAIVFPPGIDSSFMKFGADSTAARVTLIADKSDPIAPQMVIGLLQKTAMTAAPDLVARNGIADFDRHAGGLTAQQRKAVDEWLPTLAADSAGAAGDTSGRAMDTLLPVDIEDVMGQDQGAMMISFYAAGIAVMFLLFSASGGAGSMLDELDAGTLERVISSRVGMNGLLVAKWLYLTLLGCLQITVMFVYAMLVFRLPLLSRLPGFVVMTVVTAATAAAFGMVLATASRTRAQLSGISTILILAMSALGGSMFPRFLMSEAMQKAGLVAFNAWALDGYVKVFWRNAPVSALVPQVGVLLAFLVTFAVAARLLARRWERA